MKCYYFCLFMIGSITMGYEPTILREKSRLDARLSLYQALCDLTISTSISTRYIEWKCDTQSPLSNPCSWRGVSCNLTAVESLVISNINLEGTIPYSLGILTDLTRLDLSYNNLVGTIPSSLGLLSNIQWLNVGNNQLTSSIPSSLGYLTNMETISLFYNSLTSSIPTSFTMLSTSMKNFNIYDNSLTSTIPTYLGFYEKVIGLELQNNYFSSSIPSQICDLRYIQYLRVSYNRLTSSIPSCIGLMKSLEYLNSAHNAITGTIPETFKYFQNLKFIILSNNKLTGKAPEFLCSQSMLTGIYLANNTFECVPYCQSDGDWSATSTSHRCQDLQDIALYDIQQNLGILSALSRVIKTETDVIVYTTGWLQYISYPNAFQYTLVLDFRFLHAAFQCLLLYICADPSCKIVLYSWDTTGPTSFSIHRSSFYVSCPLCDLCPGWQIGYDLTIYSYIESNWKFLSSAPYNSSRVGVPYADGLCQRQWTGVSCVNGLVSSIQLPGLGLSGVLPSSIGLMSGLTVLDLSSNAIQGTIPTALAALGNLAELILANNYLNGSIPGQMSALQNLVYLGLQYNLLTGSVPTFFAQMSNLVVVYGDGNDFSGQVSSQLCTYASARNLTVSLKYSSDLACYQEGCLRGNYRRFFDSSLSECVPTSSPTTSPPTRAPTVAPTVRSVVTVRDSGLSPDATGAVIGGVLGGLLLIVIGAVLWHRTISEEAKIRRARALRLQQLPVHSALLSRKKWNEEELMELVRNYLDTVCELDYDKRTAIAIILDGLCKHPTPIEVIALLLEESLPPLENGRNVITSRTSFDLDDLDEDHERCDDEQGVRVQRRVATATWAAAVQHSSSTVCAAVESVLDRHKGHIHILANAKDQKGRCCIDIAQPNLKAAMLRRLNLFARYELRPGAPLHKSATSVVVLAKDHEEHFNHADTCGVIECSKEVVLKFMKYRDQFLREVETRAKGNFDERFVLPVLISYDIDSGRSDDTSFFHDAATKGYVEYPYCIVMEAATCNLKHVIDQQLIVANDWEQIKQMTRQLVQCLEHLHERGVVHGDLKPLNVLQVGLALKLIDLDCAAVYVDGAPGGSKFSSAYVPPEMIWRFPDGCYAVRSTAHDVEEAVHHVFPPLLVHPSQDMWALGCILYLLSSGSTLFQATVHDHLSNVSDAEALHHWTDEMKTKKLALIDNKLARNLVSMLLNKDPTKRPSASRALQHPFFTGKTVTRLMGETATWDVFISYRADTDVKIAGSIYNNLTASGLKVWWDRKCLQPGQSWEVGFCQGLVDSSSIVCILSRGGMKNQDVAWMNWENLQSDSRCDNVLLEWRLALELKERGMIQAIFPVMVGDVDNNGKFSNYFKSSCKPEAPRVAVDMVETKLQEHLDRESLGFPYRDRDTVQSVLIDVLANQGKFVEGEYSEAIEAVCSSIKGMVHGILEVTVGVKVLGAPPCLLVAYKSDQSCSLGISKYDPSYHREPVGQAFGSTGPDAALSENIIITQFQKIVDELSAQHSADTSENGSVAAVFSALKQKIGQMKSENGNVEA